MPEPTPPSVAVPPLGRLGLRAVALWRLLVAVLAGYRGEALALRAGNLTFITITSLVPLVAVIFSLLHAFNASRIDPLVLRFFEDILSPGGRAQSEQTIRTFLAAANSRAAGGLSFLVVAISAGLLLRHLDASLNDIWKVRQKRPALVSLGLYAGVLLVGPLLIAVSLLGTQGVKQVVAWADLPFSGVAYALGAVASAVLVFTCLYKFAPHAPVPWSSAFTGGAVAGIAWEAARHLYGGIASLFFSANKLYGSLGIAPLFLMWIYVGWYLILSGARLAYAVEHADFHDEFSELLEHPRHDELIATRLAQELAHASLTGSPPSSPRQLAERLKMPEQRIVELAQRLREAGLVRVTERGALEPARDVRALTLAHVSAAVGGTARLARRGPTSPAGPFAAVAQLYAQMDDATIEKLSGISWFDLARPEGLPSEKP